jgi:beta-galactosidase
MKNLNTSILVLLILTVVNCSGSVAGGISDHYNYFTGARQVLMNDHWMYLEDPIDDVTALSKSKIPWVSINLPHTWNAFDAVDPVPGYRRSASWYEKKIFIPKSVKDSRIILYFEGINTQSKVYVNKKYAGGHIGGYIGFEIDVTPFIKKGADNIIDIRADNSVDPDIIPSQKSDFFIYGGISRNVWLKVVPGQYIKSVKINTQNVSKESAQTSVEIGVVNTAPREVQTSIHAVVNDKSGNEILQIDGKKNLPPGHNSIKLDLPNLISPVLWSPANPALYTLSVKIKMTDGMADHISENYGYRWFEFKEHGPFYLNGERLLLRGTQRHEEYAGLGNAVPDSLQRKDILTAKEMGANFLRLAHYPQAPEVYRACDELGILLWDELPWCRGGVGGSVWKENTRRLLGEMIDQNYNHPSIIMWSLGNEVDWESDFQDGDNPDSIRNYFILLNELAHQLDPSRVTATRKSPEGADVVDVFSPSIWSGWYSGAYFDYEKTITDARDKYKRLFHAEYGGDSHVGRHNENPINGNGYSVIEGKDTTKLGTKFKNISLSGDWSESYIVNLFDWYLHIAENLEWFAGCAQWILKDFGTPLRPENPIPYINQKGLLDRSGKPKDAYYVYKSYWTTDPKFCYIESPTWTERAGQANVGRTVKIYSNCDEVEFLLNGVSEGKRRRDTKLFPACGLSWPVNFIEGNNALKAIGYSNGAIVCEDTLTIRYRYTKGGDADHIVLSSSPLENGNILVTAIAADKNGERNIEYSKRVYFTAEGSGRLLENYGTPTRSSIIEMANGKAQIEFEPGKSGSAIIEVRNQDFKGAYLRIRGEKE